MLRVCTILLHLIGDLWWPLLNSQIVNLTKISHLYSMIAKYFPPKPESLWIHLMCMVTWQQACFVYKMSVSWKIYVGCCMWYILVVVWHCMLTVRHPFLCRAHPKYKRSSGQFFIVSSHSLDNGSAPSPSTFDTIAGNGAEDKSKKVYSYSHFEYTFLLFFKLPKCGISLTNCDYYSIIQLHL